MMDSGPCREPDGDVDELATRVIGAAIEVRRHLGPGCLESVHEAALCVELHLRKIPFGRHRPIGVDHRAHSVGQG